MKSGNVRSGVTRKKKYYVRPTMDLPDDIMMEAQLLGRYGEVGLWWPTTLKD